MTYPGNSSLSREIQDRIVKTYEQTLDLAQSGSRQEAILGCDFILRMDPHFHPARTLLDRLKASEGAVEVSDLALGAGAAPAGDPPPGPPPPGDDASFQTVHISAEEAAALTGSGQEEASHPTPQSAPEALESLDEFPSLDDDLGPSLEGAPSLDGTELPSLDATSPFPTVDDSPAGLDPGPPPAGEAGPPPGSVDPSQALGAPPVGSGGEPPPPPPSVPGSGGGMVSEKDTDSRIQDLLEEGQAHFEKTEYQAAIDAWSRIFLIDIDHTEAARRIELARKLKAELERKVDELFHEGSAHYDAGRHPQAREAFQKVLEMQPNHLAAQEFLQQIEASGGGQPPAASLDEQLSNLEGVPGAPDDLPPPPAPAGRPSPAPSPAPGPPPGKSSLYTPGDHRPPPPSAPSMSATAKPDRSFAIIGGGVLILVLAGAWLLFTNWGKLFPNPDQQQAVAQTSAPDPIERATDLHLGGKTEAAISQLRRLPPSHPLHDQAQVLISQWQEASSPDEPEQEPPEPSRRDLARREALLERARAAYATKEFLLAHRAFEAAASIQPLDGPMLDVAEDTSKQLESMATQIDLFNEGEYELALAPLWRMHEEEPGNKDVRRLLAASYYNLGIRELQKGNPDDALKNFKEVVSIRPDDARAQRLLLFAQTYEDRPDDLLYRIFVKHLRRRK